MERSQLLAFLLVTAFSAVLAEGDFRINLDTFFGEENANNTRFFERIITQHYEYPGYDGWYNNRAHPEWGAADTAMNRKLPAAYRDGSYQPSGKKRPSPMEISRRTMNNQYSANYNGNNSPAGGIASLGTGLKSYRDRSAFLVFFGQQVVEEVLDAQRGGCPPEYFNITVPENDTDLNPNGEKGWFIPLTRSRYDMSVTGYSPNTPREQLNEITPYIDGGLMYGAGKAWADVLRSDEGGKLKSTLDTAEDIKLWGDVSDYPAVNRIRLPLANPPPPVDHRLRNVDRFFMLGNPRGNENPFLLTFGVFWYRYHNRLADAIGEKLKQSDQYMDMSQHDKDEFFTHYNEKIFNEVRKWVIATHQKIVTYDWLPSWLATKATGETFQIPSYKGYKSHVHPQIVHVFQSAAMRFGHTLVPPGVRRRHPLAMNLGTCNYTTTTKKTANERWKDDYNGVGRKAVRTCNSFWNPQQAVTENDIDALMLGMSSTITEREDTHITPDLRGFVFGGLDFSRRDLMAVNIQRARDHGLPDYNTARREYGLPEITDWTQINPTVCPDNATIENSEECFFIKGLQELYGNDLGDIDIWPGGLAETTGDGPGPLFRAVIGDQFERIRDGDRFWFENINNKLFDQGERKAIWNIRTRDIVKMVSTSELEDKELSYNPFFVNSVLDRCNRLQGRLAQLMERSDAFNFSCEAFSTEAASRNDTQTFCDEFSASVNVTLQGVSDQLPSAVAQRLSHSDFPADDDDADALTAQREAAVDYLVSQYIDCPSFAMEPPCAMDPVDGENRTDVEACTPLENFDYFTGSETPFILSFLAIALFIVLNIALLILFAKFRRSYYENKNASKKKDGPVRQTVHNTYTVTEWIGPKAGKRGAQIKLDDANKALVVCDAVNVKKHLRHIDLNHLPNSGKSVFQRISSDKGMRYLLVRVPKEYDLVLQFETSTEAEQLSRELSTFFANLNIECPATGFVPEKQLLKEAVTKAKRQKLLESFFRSVFARAFRWEDVSQEDDIGGKEAQEVISCELTKVEFAEALSLKPESLFVENMFGLIDKDQNGFVSFREFLDMIVIFAKGDAKAKARLLFDMYDISGNQRLSMDEFKLMLKSMMDLANASVAPEEMTKLIDTLMDAADLGSKTELTFEDFQILLRDHEDALGAAQLTIMGQEAAPMPQEGQKAAASMDRGKTMINRDNAPTRARKTILRAYKDDKADRIKKRASLVQVEVRKAQPSETPKNATGARGFLNRILNQVENYRLQIFWVTLYTLVVIAIFAERAYFYAVEREFAGLRRIAGYGVTVTRGAASAMMFTYSSLLVTMCRNLITFLRETFLNRFIPFDSAVSMHKLIAYYAVFFTIIHIVGHGFNFYHISTQTPADLTCLFRDYFRPTHVLPKFHYWCWNTITGFTGVLVTLLMIVMYVFATQYARRNLFRAFWITHNMYVVFFFLMIFHGAGMLVQPPFFFYFFLGPVILFTLDKLVSLSRNKVEISVMKAELLPSDVTGLTFKRPQNFEYKSGQWVRIACLALGEGEYHPFTISSSPHEDHLSLHIRAIGPWTRNLRNAYDPLTLRDKPYPKLYLDGPFGEGHQDWFRFEISVLVGGGIGVTPFASILKDIVHKSSLGTRFSCKKVYFLWVTRTQKQYEWLVDIIREVEEKDEKDFVSVHLFVTQFQQKFDLRTTMLYICERHFQKVSNRSLFTGLRSITHFGRPDFNSFFRSLIEEHGGVSQVGVFSCGPPQMTNGVEQACAAINKTRTDEDPAFSHHFENF